MDISKKFSTLLALWEDVFFLVGCIQARNMVLQRNNETYQITLEGPVLCWPALRDALATGTFDNEAFTYQGDIVSLKVISAVPALLWNWIYDGKRVFHFGSAAHQACGQVDVTELKWKDVVWPLSTFAMTFERAFAKLNGDIPLTAVIVIPFDDESSGVREVAALFIPAGLDSYCPLGEDGRNALLGASQVELTRVWDEMAILLPQFDWKRYKTPADDPVPSSQLVEGFLAQSAVFLAHGMRRPRTEQTVVSFDPLSSHPSVPADSATICDIGREGLVMVSHVAGQDQGSQVGRQLPPHTRRAHMRRPKGSPFDAPKTIKVGQARVHMDDLPEGAVPAGSIGTVKG